MFTFSAASLSFIFTSLLFLSSGQLYANDLQKIDFGNEGYRAAVKNMCDSIFSDGSAFKEAPMRSINHDFTHLGPPMQYDYNSCFYFWYGVYRTRPIMACAYQSSNTIEGCITSFEESHN